MHFHGALTPGLLLNAGASNFLSVDADHNPLKQEIKGAQHAADYRTLAPEKVAGESRAFQDLTSNTVKKKLQQRAKVVCHKYSHLFSFFFANQDES